MRRNTIRWGFGIAIIASVSGCASLLGDFTTSDETNGDDGGPKTDGSQNTTEGSVNGDDGGVSDGNGSPQDGTVVDASEAGAVVPLACVEQGHGGVRTKLGSIGNSGSNDSYSVQLFNTSVGNDTTYRAVVPENKQSGPSTYHVYSFSNGGGSSNVSDIPVPITNGNLLQVVRYPGGLAAFGVDSVSPDAAGEPNANVLQVFKLADSSNTWSAPVSLANMGSSCTNRIEGRFVVNSALTDDYYGELTFQNCAGTMTTHTVGRYENGVGAPGFWQLPPENMELADGGSVPPPSDAGPPAFDLAGLAVSGNGIYAMTNPSGNNGPDPGIGAVVYTAPASLAGGASPYEMPLVDPADIMQGLSITSLASTGGLGFGILEANLSSQTVTPIIYTGSVPGSKLASLNPATDLHSTTLASISDLPINNATYHWESFVTNPPSDNFLAVGSVFPNNNGLNFIWWDGVGDVRAQKTNLSSFFYFDPSTAGLGIYGGDVTFSSSPLPAIAGFELVFIQTDGDAATVNDVWATQINCAPQ
jgi:hypothetical protein